MELGASEKEITGRSAMKLPLIMIGIVLPWGAVLIAWAAATRHPTNVPAPSTAHVVTVVGIAAAVAVALTFASRWLIKRLRPNRLQLFANGFVFQRGRSTQTVLWSDVRAMRDVRQGNLRILRLDLPDQPFELHAHLVGNQFADAIVASAPRSLST